MEKNNIADVKSLASYVLFRDFYDEGKNDIYFIISKFAENIIKTKRKYKFSVKYIASELKNTFGFSIPEYVIQTSLGKIDYIYRQDHLYYVKIEDNLTESRDITLRQEIIIQENNKILNELIVYIEHKKRILSSIEKEKIVTNFCRFLLEENNGSEYYDLISAFILEKSKDIDFLEQIKSIKEGAVLYAGLNYNSNILPKHSWKKELNIFLENEILFHLAGFNGEVFKLLAEDTISLVSEMNRKSKKILLKLQYFKDVRDIIEQFFTAAEDIIRYGNRDIVVVNKDAMNSIIENCATPTDLILKKTAFFRFLEEKGIKEAPEYDFYDIENHEYSLEGTEIVEKYSIDSDKLRYIKHISYVNILRKNVLYEDLSKVGFVVLTETGKILRMANDFTEKKKVPLAINMNVLTNRLWYDLNKGFGAENFPKTFDAVIKAKMVLANLLADSISLKYDKVREEYKQGRIDKNDLLEVIANLREKSKKPEEINENNIENTLDGISRDDVDRYIVEKRIVVEDYEKARTEVSKYENLYKEEKEKSDSEIKKNENLSIEHKRLIKEKKDGLENNQEKILNRKNKIDKKIEIEKNRLSWGYNILLVLILFGIIYLLCNDPKYAWWISFFSIILKPISNKLLSKIRHKETNILYVCDNILKTYLENKTTRLYKEFDINLNELEQIKKQIKCLQVS